MNRGTTRTTGDRTAMGISRAIIDKINDSPFLQTMGLKILGGEPSSDVEHAHPFGSTAYPMGATTDEQAKAGQMRGNAEVFTFCLMGNRSHPVGLPAIDRRFRPNGMKAGEHVLHDAFKQALHFGESAARLFSPKKVFLGVAKEKQQQGGQQEGQGQQKRNNGVNVAAEMEVPVGLTFNEDGSWELVASKPGKIRLGDTVWHFEATGLRQEGGDAIKHNGHDVGQNHRHKNTQPGTGTSGEPI